MFKNILLALDLVHEGSWSKALPTAVEHAQKFDATLHLVTVVPSFGMSIVGTYFPADFESKATDEARKRLAAFAKEQVPDGVSVKTHVALGRSYEEILAAAKKLGADLIVIGSHQPGTEDYLLGSTASRVVRFASCSVLVVRS